MILLLLLAVLIPASSWADESWIEGRWKLSRSHTIAELSQGDPESRALLDVQMSTSDVFWEIDSGQIEISRDGADVGRTNYFTRPVEEGIFEMIFDLEDGDQNYILVFRHDFGFCYAFGGDYSSDPFLESKECYVRVYPEEELSQEVRDGLTIKLIQLQLDLLLGRRPTVPTYISFEGQDPSIQVIQQINNLGLNAHPTSEHHSGLYEARLIEISGVERASPTELRASIAIRGGGGYGGTYTLEQNGGDWNVTNTERSWMR